MNILIVDDEPLARQRLRWQLEDLGVDATVVDADNGLEALARAAELNPDVVLLDVRMPGMDGLETARHLAQFDKPPIVIFTTAYDEHALAAFESHALAYLLKPVRSERLSEALNRAEMMSAGRQVLSAAASDALGRRRHVSAMVSGNLRLMPLHEIYYFQADQGYVSAVSATGRLLLEESLKSLEDEFSDDFARVHRSALVNLNHVEGLRKDADGNTVVEFNGFGDRLMVSRRLLSAVRKRLRSG